MDTPALNSPVIILGAARSGTKLIRSILGVHPQLNIVPYDINYVWTMGNYGLGHDELKPSDLKPEIREFVREFLGKFNTGILGDRIVEKTVSNTLRVPFVDTVFPHAQFVVITRDGRDVAGSVREQWSTRTPSSQLLAKLKTFPAKQAWSYGTRYLENRLAALLPWNEAVKSWGPQFEGMGDYARSHELIETCAMQWVKSVEGTNLGLAEIDPGRVISVLYENLVRTPFPITRDILTFLGLDMTPSVEDFCANHVTPDNIGKWRHQISPMELDLIRGLVEPVLEKAGIEI